MTHQPIVFCGEFKPNADGFHATVKIRLQIIDGSIQVGWTEEGANTTSGEVRIDNDELALAITIKLCHKIREPLSKPLKRMRVCHNKFASAMVLEPGRQNPDFMIALVLTYDAQWCNWSL